jgi:hypothetical protein
MQWPATHIFLAAGGGGGLPFAGMWMYLQGWALARFLLSRLQTR